MPRGRGRESNDKRRKAPCAVQCHLVMCLLSLLLSLTVFLSGEQMERSGLFHLPCILWLLTACVYIGLCIGKPSSTKQQDRSPAGQCVVSWPDLFVYGFFAWVIVSLFANLLPGDGDAWGAAPRAGFNMLSVWLSLAAAWFLFRQILHETKIIDAVFAVLLAILLTEASLGLYQNFVDIPVMLRQFEANPQAVLAQIDPSIQPGTPDWERLASRLKTAGPMGTYQLTNTLGGFLGTGLVFLLGFLFLRKKPNRNASFSAQSILVLLFVLAVALCFWLAKCRSAYVAVAVGLSIAALMSVDAQHSFPSFVRKHRFALFMALFALAGFIGTMTGGKGMLDGAKRSLGFRLEYWAASMNMVADHPFFGCGSGNFKQTYTRYKLPQSSEEIADPHNFLVEIAAVAGVPALILLVIPLGTLVCRSLFLRRQSQDEPQSAIADPINRHLVYWFGFAGCLLAFIVSFDGEAPMDFMAPVFAFLSFALVYFIAFSKTETKTWHIPRSLMAVALCVLCIHLLAAGGISATNTAICFWLLAALLANRDELFQNTVSIHRRVAILVCVVVIAVCLFVHFVCNSSERACLTRVENLQQNTPPNFPRDRILHELETVVTLDPLSAACREALATERFRQWLAGLAILESMNDDSQIIKQIQSQKLLQNKILADQAEAMRLNPRSAGLRLVFAERLAMMYDKTQDAALLEKAVALFQEAIERYPNNAKYRASFALFLSKTDKNNPEALRQRVEAHQLDDIMPHADQKLPPEVRRRLESISP